MYVSYGTRSTYYFAVYLADLHTTITCTVYFGTRLRSCLSDHLGTVIDDLFPLIQPACWQHGDPSSRGVRAVFERNKVEHDSSTLDL